MKSADTFSYITSIVVTPAILVAGTYFPLSGLPEWAQVLGQINPLYHCVELVRHAAFGWQGWSDVGHVGRARRLRPRDVAARDLADREAPDRLARAGCDVAVDSRGGRRAGRFGPRACDVAVVAARSVPALLNAAVRARCGDGATAVRGADACGRRALREAGPRAVRR